MPSHLRPEARPAGYELLSSVQQRAYGSLVELICEAIGDVDKPRQVDPEDLMIPDWLDDRRAARVAFLDGKRGTGKSTVLLSLVNDAVRNRQRGHVEHLQKIPNRVIWLEPLDMEPLPAGTNLLAAILARIEETARQFGYEKLLVTDKRNQPRLSGQGAEYHDFNQSLRTLQSDFAVAWDLQLTEYSNPSDLDRYALDVMRLERARLRVNRKLRDMLDRLAAVIPRSLPVHDPIFVLGVDDFDLNPARCIDLLRLLRTISIPRLFLVVLGDVSIARSLFGYKVSSELAGVLQPHPVEKVNRGAISDIADEVSGNAIRKLVPPRHTIPLTDYSVRDALGFRPFSADQEKEPRLLNQLARVPFEISIAEMTRDSSSTGRSIRNLAELCCFPAEVSTRTRVAPAESEMAWSAVRLLASPARHLTDLYAGIEPVTRHEKVTQESELDLIRFARTLCLAAIQEQPDLTAQQRDALITPLQKDRQVGWDLSPLDEQLVCDVSVRASVGFVEADREFLGFSTTEWGFLGWTGRRVDRLIAAIQFYHDIIELSSFGTIRKPVADGSSMFPEPLALTVWHSFPDVRISWPSPWLRSFWEADVFRFAWQRPMKSLRANDTEHRFVNAWIAANTQLASYFSEARATFWSDDPESLTDGDSAISLSAITGDCGHLAESLLKRKTRRRGRQFNRDHVWLINLGVLLMPEYGLQEFAEQFLQDCNPALFRFWHANWSDLQFVRRRQLQDAEYGREFAHRIDAWLAESAEPPSRPQSVRKKILDAHRDRNVDLSSS